MVRARKGEPGHEQALAKWRKSMEERFGGPDGVRKKFIEMGRKGGHISKTGGFASDKVGSDGLTGKERARLAGRKGGKISKRGSKKEATND